jgi:farnesyl diphosphate synthase/geranylgeranyl diphosphate synthase type II
MPDEDWPHADQDRHDIDRVLAEVGAEARTLAAGAVGEAMAYALAGGGKRMRGLLLLAAHRACGGGRDAARLAASVEIAHTYSLVHDDLPCMDDDDMRRGRLTVHKVFGVPTATVAGLTMIPLAAATAYRGAREVGLDDSRARRVLARLMAASGAGGMVGGQLLDLDFEGRDGATVGDLERIHRGKTGALIEAAVAMGAMGAATDDGRLAALSRYGAQVGLAFQIADDLLDVTSTTAKLGKTAGRDAARRKSTYPALLGVEGARRRAAALVDAACRSLEGQGLDSAALESLARYTVARES